ncbi:MAG TPA: glycosyltransferase [Steroidobacteraceae bacterium]|jgi:glycosyltransferase involved in cell wall biosynthesis|nr:glycosyltransferase [Steroidobacteraceae bacterium]
MSPAVSIVLPTFNRLEFLPAAVESVRAQTFSDWELIIADDGSDGATRDYLRTLHDGERIRVLWLEHSGRPAVARNAAIRAARGAYVAFLDSDDLWLPDKLIRQMTSLQPHGHRHWSHTRFALTDGSGRIVQHSPRGAHAAKSGWIWESLLTGETVIALPTVVVSRVILEQLGGFDESFRMCEDNDLWLRLATRSEIDAVPEPLTLVRRHDQHSGDDVTAWEDRLRIFEGLLREQAGSPCESLIRSRCAAQSAGLARSQAASGMRMRALATVLSSAPRCWRKLSWWPDALRATIRACAPRPVVSFIRSRRHHRRTRAKMRCAADTA